MAVATANSQGPLAIQAGGDGNGRSTRPARGKGNSTPASAVPFPPLRNRLKALVVDDMSTCQMCQRGVLESLGVETDIAENGEHAVEIFTGGASHDLVLY